MRGEPNAVGIPTKRAPSHSSRDFLLNGGVVVLPRDGIGTGSVSRLHIVAEPTGRVEGGLMTSRAYTTAFVGQLLAGVTDKGGKPYHLSSAASSPRFAATRSQCNLGPDRRAQISASSVRRYETAREVLTSALAAADIG